MHLSSTGEEGLELLNLGVVEVADTLDLRAVLEGDESWELVLGEVEALGSLDVLGDVGGVWDNWLVLVGLSGTVVKGKVLVKP